MSTSRGGIFSSRTSLCRRTSKWTRCKPAHPAPGSQRTIQRYSCSMSRAPLLQALAEQLGAMADDISEQDVEQLLKKVPLTLGAGKHKISLFDALPSFAVRDLAGIVQDFARNQ